jgi:Protein of unknown function (DUF3592)
MGYTITLTIGVILLVISIYLFKRSVDFIDSGIKTTATVIELEAISDSDGTTYKPIFRFLTHTNQTIIYRDHASSSPAVFEVGEEVGVVYDREDPNNVKILTYTGAFIWTIVLACLSLPLIVVGGGYFLTQSLLR